MDIFFIIGILGFLENIYNLIEKLKIKRFNLLYFVIFFHLINQIGLILLFIGVNEYLVTERNYIISQCMFYNILAIYFIRIGFNLTRLKIADVSIKVTKLRVPDVLFILYFSTLPFFFYYLYKIQKIPLIALITNGLEAGKVARSNIYLGFGSHSWILELVAKELSSFLFLVFFAYFLCNKRFYKLIGIAFLCQCFILTASTEKAPLIYFLCSILIVYALKINNLRVLFKGIPILIIIFFPLIIWMQCAYHNLLLECTTGYLNRIFVGTIYPSLVYLDYIKENGGFFLGRTLPNPAHIFNFEVINIAKDVWKFAHPVYEREIIGSMPTAFWAESYINFGIYGIIFFSVYIGFLMKLFCIIVELFEIFEIKISLIAWGSIHFLHTYESGIGMFLLDTNLICVLATALLLNKYSK